MLYKKLFAHPKPYNEHYKIAADTDFLLRLLLRKDINVHYLQRYIVKMRMGGLSTDRKRRKQMWQEDVAIFKSLGFRYPLITKLEKIFWKIPQYIKAKFI